MANGTLYINSGTDIICTLKVLAQTCEDEFPVAATVQPPDYEFMFGNHLQPDEDVLIFRSTQVPFVKVKVLPFYNEDSIIKTKGSEFVKERNKFVNQEFLFPCGYAGLLQSTIKNRNRLSSISQMLYDPPVYVHIFQKIECKSPLDGKVQTIPKDTKLEIISVRTFHDTKYIECRSSDNKTFYIAEDCPINGKSLHTLSSIVRNGDALPQSVVFEPVDPYDVLLSDDDEAQAMMIILDGPISIMSTCTRNVYVAWMKCDASKERRQLAVIPEEVWSSIQIKLYQFGSDVEKMDYMKQYGVYFDSEFIVNSLYKMLPTENGVVMLSEPRIVNKDDYEEPFIAVPLKSEINNPEEEKESVLLPTAKNIGKNPGKLKPPNIHGLAEHIKAKCIKITRHKLKPTRRETHEVFSLPANVDNSSHRDTTDGREQKDKQTDLRLEDKDMKVGLKSEPNVTIQTQAVKPVVNLTLQRKAGDHQGYTHLRGLVDMDKISRPDQTKDDFCEYKQEEVVECFKLCGLNSLAKDCNEYNLDGASFRHVSYDDLKSIFNLSQIEVFKVRNTIEHGWRPKLNS